MSVIKGLFRAKLRTILNLIIMIAVAVAVCITLNVPFGTGGAQKEFPENSITQSEQEDNSLTASSTASNQSQTDENAQNVENLPNGENGEENADAQKTQPNRNNVMNSVTIVTLIGIAVVGAGLLIGINVVSTKKREEEISRIISAGVDKKVIKKQFFIEAFLTVLVAGIIGTAIGACVAAPVSNAVMESKMTNMAANKGDRQIPTNENGEQMTRPDRENAVKPTNENGEEITGGYKGNFEAPDDENGDMPALPSDSDEKRQPADRPNNQTNNYFLMCIVSLCYTIGLALISGFFCCNPIEKINARKILDEEEKANE